MLKLLKYFKNYRKEAVCAPFFKLLEATFELLVPLVVAKIIDNGIAEKDIGYIVKMSLLMVALGAIGLISTLIAQFFAAKASVGFVKQVRHTMFDRFQSLSFSEIDTVGTSNMITLMTSDVNQVQNGVNLTLRLFMRSPFIVFGAMVMAFTIDFKSAITFVVTIPLLSIVVFGIMLITIPLYKKVQNKLNTVLNDTRENLLGVRVIRAFCKEKTETENFDSDNNSLALLQKFVGKISALMNPLTYVIINFAIIVLIYKGAVSVNSGRISTGQVIALYNYMSQILIELIKLANLIINITKTVACGNRIQTVLEIKSSMQETDNPQPIRENGSPAVEFDNVNLKYNGAGDYSLKGLDFKVNCGETVGIIGSTGSGKTSLINLITRFYDATDGTVKIFGNDIKDYSTKDLHRFIGIVMQHSTLFRGTVKENIKFSNENATDDDVISALKTAEAYDFCIEKDGGLDTITEAGGKNFSGGQRQRLIIARTLLLKPKILIFDDSFSALDYATEAKLRNNIKKLDFKPTVFIVSQRASSIMYADKIIVMDDGKISGIGTHKDLFNNNEIYTEIYNTQFKSGVKQ